MPRLEPGSSKPECTHTFIPTLITLPSSPTIIDQKPCILVVSPWPQLSLTLATEIYSGTPCHSTMTTTHQPAAHPSPHPSPTATASANKSTPLTQSGTALPARTVTTVRGATTLANTVPTCIPSVSPSRNVWYHSPITAHCLGRHASVLHRLSMPGTTLTTGDMTVRTILTTTMIGRLDAWKHQAGRGVMS